MVSDISNPPPLNPTLELTPEAMRALGYQVVDLLVDHFHSLSEQQPVKPATRASMEWLLNESLPETGMAPEAVLQHVKTTILENTAALNHPRFFAFVPSPGNFVSAMADALASGFNVFTGAWVSSPGAAEIEILTINWLLKLFNLPVREGGGLFVSGGSMANLTALSTARQVKLGGQNSKAVIYYSDQTHSSVDRALLVLGFQKEQIRRLPSDSQYRLPIDALSQAIEADQQAGRLPFCVVANAGTTNTGTVDELHKVAMVCRTHRLWFHVDAAYGGGAILTSQGKAQLDGIELADSITVDPHKWWFQPYEIGCVLVRDHRWMSGTFRMNPEYLRDIQGNSEEINFYDYGVQLTRGFRALKLYMSLKTFGLASFRQAVQQGLQQAEETEAWLRRAPHWEVLSPATLAVLNFRYHPKTPTLSEAVLDDINESISNRLIQSGYAMVTTTQLKGKRTLRLCLINPRTSQEDITQTIKRLEGYAQEYLREFSPQG